MLLLEPEGRTGASGTGFDGRDHVVVGYRSGPTRLMKRRGATWDGEWVGAGDVSLLTAAEAARIRWDDPAGVVRLPLPHQDLLTLARRMYHRPVAEVSVAHAVRLDDPLLHRTLMMADTEAGGDAVGRDLLVTALTCQLAVQVLRRHAQVSLASPPAAEPAPPEGLSGADEQTVRDYVSAHLTEPIRLDALAATIGLSRYQFIRRFRTSTGTTPYDYVLAERVAQARQLLEQSTLPLVEVAATCGFADQSHLTRVFRSRLGVTPGQYRARAAG